MIDPVKTEKSTTASPTPLEAATPKLIGGAIFGLVFGFLLQKGGVGKYNVLIGQLLPNSQLGQSGSGGVATATIVGARIGTLTYGDVEFQGIEMVARVRLAEGINPVA